jgi:hypothetical protein
MHHIKGVKYLKGLTVNYVIDENPKQKTSPFMHGAPQNGKTKKD